MDSEELDSANASLSWLNETAFIADSMPLESMDFAIFSGDVVPRDGIQRPILTGGDGTRPHARRAVREKPVHVTHVHQTVIQSTLPVAQVHVTTPAEVTLGLTCLERAISARPGSICKPTSKWRHRTKAQVESGVPPHAPNGTLSFGTNLLQQTVQLQPEADVLDMIATPAASHMQDTPLLPTPCAMRAQVLKLIALAKVRKHAVVPTHMPVVITNQHPNTHPQRRRPSGRGNRVHGI